MKRFGSIPTTMEGLKMALHASRMSEQLAQTKILRLEQEKRDHRKAINELSGRITDLQRKQRRGKS